MSQQYQPQARGVQQSQSLGTPTQQGQQFQQDQQVQQFQPAHFDEDLRSELRAALEDLSWLRKQTKWAAERAHATFQGSGIETTLEAISEIAELNEELILSRSKFVPYQADTFLTVATEAIRELQQFEQEQFVGAVITDLLRAIHSVEELLTVYQGSNQQSGAQTSGQGQPQGQIPTRTRSQPPMQSQQSQPFTGSQY
ncbi:MULTISPECIES: hypothetical protein [Halorussus]|uniref:hypothetical protein n=1 Tax=Halorussus TaxID=1070314 RepID=UPI0020A05F74|nr:hypothetical protein [Halorussus vallis]USZ77757.1 hypothetical protein NGM07_21485 [Halorussus vallis]